MRRLFVLPVTVALLTSTTMLARTAANAEFVSGTVKSIPANTTGSLDAGGSSELSFHYGKSVFSLPYQNITNTEVTEPTGHHLWKVPVPKLGKSARFLNITYREGDISRMLTFKAPAGEVTALVTAINGHRKGPKAEFPQVASAPKKAASSNASAKAVSTKDSKKTASSKAAQKESSTDASTKEASIKTDKEVWWGDQYWRTTRNKAKWPQVPAENSPGGSGGTKE